MKRFLRYWLPPLLWCAIIFIQSAFATPAVVPRWPYFDKVLHTGVYGLLGFLFYRALNTLPGLAGRRFKLILLATVMTTLYGLSDEWHQSFVAARSAELADLAADFFGGASGSFLYSRIGKGPLERFGKSPPC